MVKRVYTESVKKWAKGIGISGISLVGLIFMYLIAIGSISNVSYSGDMVCAGTESDPCYAYINFTANEDIFIYPMGYDPWGRNTLFDFDPNVKSWRLERSWGSGWRNIPLDTTCTGTWCGAKDNKGCSYSVAFRDGRDYQIRIVALKNSPRDRIKWGAFSGVDRIDPVWEGIAANIDFISPRENISTNVNNFNLHVNATATGSENISLISNYDNSLIVWITFDDNNKTGDDYVYKDYIGNNHFNSSTNRSSTGYFKDGITLRNSTDATKLNSGSLSQNINNNITVSLWVKIPYTLDEVPYYERIFGTDDDNFRLFFDHLNDRLALKFGTTEGTAPRPTIPNAQFEKDKWFHLVVVYDMDKLYLYKDGVAFDTKTRDGTPMTHNNKWEISAVASPFNGSVDDLMIFNRSLTLEEIKVLYANSTHQELDTQFYNLSEGLHSIIIYVQDTLGNIDTLSRALLIDTIIPSLNLIFPSADIIQSDDNFTIQMNSTDTNNISLFMNYQDSLMTWITFDDNYKSYAENYTYKDYMNHNHGYSDFNLSSSGKFGEGVTFNKNSSETIKLYLDIFSGDFNYGQFILTPAQTSGHLQGFDVDEEGNLYWMYTTKLIKTYENGTVISSVATPGHSGGVCYSDGLLFNPWSDGGTPYWSWNNLSLNNITIYNSTTLEVVANIEIFEPTFGIAVIDCYDGYIYVGDGSATDYEGVVPMQWWRYNASTTLEYIDTHVFEEDRYPNTYGWQTLGRYQDEWVLCSYESARYFYSYDNDWNYIGNKSGTSICRGFADYDGASFFRVDEYTNPILYDGRYRITKYKTQEINNNITVSLWAKIPYTLDELGGSEFQRIFGTEDDNFRLFFRGDSSSLQLKFNTTQGTTPRPTIPNAQFEKDKWFHLVVVYDMDKLYLYKDGVLYDSDQRDGTPISNNNKWEISSDTSPFNGSVDDLMIFNRSLSAEEIQALYANSTHHELNVTFENLSTGKYSAVAYTQDIAGNINETEKRTITINSCGCPGVDIDWSINMEDCCNLTSSCNIGTGNIIWTGEGYFNCSTQINLTNRDAPPSNSIFYFSNGCEIVHLVILIFSIAAFKFEGLFD